MNTELADMEWSLLHLPLAILVASLGVTAVLLTSSWYYQQQMQEEQKKAQEALKKIEEQHKKSEEALKVYQSFAEQFTDLKKYNFLQPTERTSQWYERIESLKSWQDFFIITHLQLESPQDYYVAGVAMEKDFKVKLWQLRLQIHILHMGNLLEFIDYLYAVYEDGLYNIQACELSFNKAFDFKWQDDVKDVRLEGYCILQWYAGDIKAEEQP